MFSSISKSSAMSAVIFVPGGFNSVLFSDIDNSGVSSSRFCVVFSLPNFSSNFINLGFIDTTPAVALFSSLLCLGSNLPH